MFDLVKKAVSLTRRFRYQEIAAAETEFAGRATITVAREIAKSTQMEA